MKNKIDLHKLYLNTVTDGFIESIIDRSQIISKLWQKNKPGLNNHIFCRKIYQKKLNLSMDSSFCLWLEWHICLLGIAVSPQMRDDVIKCSGTMADHASPLEPSGAADNISSAWSTDKHCCRQTYRVASDLWVTNK